MESECASKTMENGSNYPSSQTNNDARPVETNTPVALTYIPCKLMECIILKRITHVMEMNLFPEEQYDFRRGYSNTGQILYIV
ncbi:hypothetical protein TNCT_657381 [Trichonephila clavata]|uniref:Reverse transcriptase domain-containing protein n=1 Tax=Trichonephila clavata TaxID=2740835 RepID=A0A8X6KSU2_TRICU|nr:hypothetical protein TNCT_657381 [Trichonephila clavata]